MIALQAVHYNPLQEVHLSRYWHLDAIIAEGKPVADAEDMKKRFNLLKVSFEQDGRVKSYEVNQEKLDNMLLTAGFFAGKTIVVDFDPLLSMDNHGMRDEQEKCFALQKGPLGHDRLRVWSEGGLILASYVRSVWSGNDFLRKKYDSTEAVLAEMRTIRCIEHRGHMKFITPFVGNQVEICKIFGFEIPEGCAPKYV